MRQYLFVLEFKVTSRNFHSYGDVTIAGEGPQILIYARHSWPLSSEGSLACHTYHYMYTGHPFIWLSPRTRDTHTYYRAFSSGAVTTSFNDLGLSRLGFEHPTQPSACGVNALTHCAPAAPAAIGTACS